MVRIFGCDCVVLSVLEETKVYFSNNSVKMILILTLLNFTNLFTSPSTQFHHAISNSLSFMT